MSYGVSKNKRPFRSRTISNEAQMEPPPTESRREPTWLRRLDFGSHWEVPPWAVLVAVGCAALWLFPWYHAYREDITPIGAAIGGAILAWIAFGQMKTARLRHEEQTKADNQRRITESFSKATEALASDKLEVRLGAIYTLEGVSQESDKHYWPVIETLCAFVRDKAHWREPEEQVPEKNDLFYETQRPSGYEMPTDIAAVLSVIKRRGET